MRKNSPKREYRDYLTDIVYAIEKIEKFTKGTNLERFKKDEKTIFAVIRAFEIIGEATKNVPAKIKNEYKKVPWKLMSGMRDKLVHEYFGVNKEVVWKTVKKDIPDLKDKMDRLLSELKISKLI